MANVVLSRVSGEEGEGVAQAGGMRREAGGRGDVGERTNAD